MGENSNGRNIGGIVLRQLPLTPEDQAFAVKLERFNCVVSLDEPGCGKTYKAQLAVYDILKKDSGTPPNILIITSGGFMFSWYQAMVSGIGADFKFVRAEKSGICFFSPSLSNLLIMDGGSILSDSRPAVVDAIEQSGLVWDLVIVDITDTDFILSVDKLNIKTKKLAVFAQALPEEQDKLEKLRGLTSRFLASPAPEWAMDTSAGMFNMDTPVMKYDRPLSDPSSAVKFTEINYEVSEELCRLKEEQPKRRGGSSGGNIFEELTVDKRELYVETMYDKNIVNQLLLADPKLMAYKIKLEEILSDPSACAITYFTDSKTLEYIEKVLSVILPDNCFADVRTDGVFDTQATVSRFCPENKRQLSRVILASDMTPDILLGVGEITHVLNYELPGDPRVLQQRYKRHGEVGFGFPEFVVFSDSAGQFDGRVLNKVLTMNMVKCFNKGIPGGNIYLYRNGLEKHICAAIREMKKISGLPAGHQRDMHTSEFCAEYNLDFSGYEQLNAYVSARLEKLLSAFQISGEGDAGAAEKKVREKLAEIRAGAPYISETGEIKCAPPSYKNERYAGFARESESSVYSAERENAAGLLEERINGVADGKIPYISDLVASVSPYLRSGTLLNVYRLLTETGELEMDYSRFIRYFNEGVI